MRQYSHYVGRFRVVGGRLTGLPPWAKAIVGVAALPGAILVVLSIAAFVISILALLLLTLPVYRLLSAVTSAGGLPSPETRQDPQGQVPPPPAFPGRRHVDVKVIEPQEP